MEEKISFDEFERRYGISASELEDMKFLFDLIGLDVIDRYEDKILVNDKLEELMRSEEFKKLRARLVKKVEYPVFNIFSDEYISIVKTDIEKPERFLDVPMPIVDSENSRRKILLEFVPSKMSDDFLCDCFNLAFRHGLKIQNADFWRWFVINKAYPDYRNANLFPLGLFKRWTSFSNKHLDIATINGFRKEFIEYLGSEGLLLEVNLTEEEKKEFRDLLVNNAFTFALKFAYNLKDFCFYVRKFEDFKDEFKKFFDWVFSLNPKKFKEKIYKLTLEEKIKFAPFAPDELSEYFAKKIIEGR